MVMHDMMVILGKMKPSGKPQVFPTAQNPYIHLQSGVTWRYCAGQYVWYSIYMRRTEHDGPVVGGVTQRRVRFKSSVFVYMRRDGKTFMRVWRKTIERPLLNGEMQDHEHPRRAAFNLVYVKRGGRTFANFCPLWNKKDIDVGPLCRCFKRKLAKFRSAKHFAALHDAERHEVRVSNLRRAMVDVPTPTTSFATMLRKLTHHTKKAAESRAIMAAIETSPEAVRQIEVDNKLREMKKQYVLNMDKKRKEDFVKRQADEAMAAGDYAKASKLLKRKVYSPEEQARREALKQAAKVARNQRLKLKRQEKAKAKSAADADAAEALLELAASPAKRAKRSPMDRP